MCIDGTGRSGDKAAPSQSQPKRRRKQVINKILSGSESTSSESCDNPEEIENIDQDHDYHESSNSNPTSTITMMSLTGSIEVDQNVDVSYFTFTFTLVLW